MLFVFVDTKILQNFYSVYIIHIKHMNVVCLFLFVFIYFYLLPFQILTFHVT